MIRLISRKVINQAYLVDVGVERLASRAALFEALPITVPRSLVALDPSLSPDLRVALPSRSR